MKILNVIATMDPISGGPCQVIRCSVPDMKKNGIINEVVCLDCPPTNKEHLDDFKVYYLSESLGPWRYNRKLNSWLMANLSQYHSVIIHGLWHHPGYAVVKALERLQKKALLNAKPIHLPNVFVMPHGMLDPYFQRAANRKFKAARNFIFWKFIEKNLIKKADAVLFTCQSELELARLPFKPYNPKQELNVGLGTLPPPPESPSMHDVFDALIPGGRPKSYFLFLARLHEKKGVDMLIEAYAELVGRNPDLPHLVIAGPGMDTSYGRLLLQMVEHFKMKGKIIFAGMLTGEAKWGAFYGCAAYVLTSHQENFGISVVEALACGKPVLISDQVNIWQEIEACEAGFVAEDSKAGAIKVLEKWMQLPAVQHELMSRNAKACFEKHFTVEQYTRNIHKLLVGQSTLVLKGDVLEQV